MNCIATLLREVDYRCFSFWRDHRNRLQQITADNTNISIALRYSIYQQVYTGQNKLFPTCKSNYASHQGSL